jgi:pSer/pThr/pTyr-binding forkhead associated (FHA) protein
MFFRSSRSRPTFEEGWTLYLQSGPGAPCALALASPVLTLGRDPGCELCLADDQRVSRRHARLSYEEGEWLVEDLGSANGTFLGRERVLRATPMAPGDELRVGLTLLVLEGPARAPGLELVDSEFDGLETQVADREGDAVLAGLLARLDTEVEEGVPAAPSGEPEPEPTPQAAEPPRPAGRSTRAAAPSAPEAPALAPDEPVPPVSSAAAERCLRVEWTADGLGARLRFLGPRPVSTEQLHRALTALRPPAQVNAQLTEVLGESGASLQLQAAPGAQPQLVQCAGEIINCLTSSGLCAQVVLAPH